MSYHYKTEMTCSKAIDVELQGNIVKKVTFTGGCNGNTQGVARLVEGLTVEEVQEKCAGITCGMKNTSCPDQLAKAVLAAYENQEN